ncbi:hypothetical protein AQ490_01800 [Wenjunlia vitaminophila]|uniref:DUF3515 domain-containing protein n=1 Tax=Wenjunlia vitaminophila TaxID=76728 RepID=A0A0T6LYT6_WENVI|nr:hypothetical protein AQ490_01800 [Wenjunlia vitaminophila]
MLCAVAAPALAGCFPTALEVQPPSPQGPAAELCRALHVALPKTVDGDRARDVEPDSPYTAAWGDPAVVLRCGTELPPVLDPYGDAYDPTTEAVGVEGVDWLPEQEADGVRFTTVGRRALVQVWVPKPPGAEVTAPLVDLATAVRRTVPTRL